MNAARPALPPGPYLVVGMARSGVAVAGLLTARGERVTGTDSGTPDVAAGGFELALGTDGVALLDGVTTVVKSPGVPREAPVVVAALERGITVTGELEIAWRLLPNRFVAVTGTNGKTTTVELLGAIWREAGEPVAVAGNVGTPLASLVGQISPGTTVIAECSSFQLEDCLEFAPECAVLLNIEPDHIDRHGTFAAYREAKLSMFERLGPDAVAVAPAAETLPGMARRITFAAGDVEPDAIALPGDHNRDNAAAAAAAARAMGIPEAAIGAALASFAGVAHRLEVAAERGGVRYVNDSKATNVASAARGIGAFGGGVHVILGGSLKGGGFAGLREVVTEHCRACYLIGEAASQLLEDLSGTVPLVESGTLEQAVADAAAAAAAGDVVLLSPACASFDAFADYEQRGERFRELARSA